ncbi:MAG: isoprenylcysteine carboxylmethyltransferase family protein [Vicinamibacterales bacterium]
MTQTVRALGFALFMSAMGYLGWWWLQLPNAPHAALWPAALLDTMLFSAFAVHHSVLARPFARRGVERVLPAGLVRSAYVWVASILQLTVCVGWQPVGRTLYHATGVAAFGAGLLQVLGVLLGVLAVRRISVRELGGLVPAHPSDTVEATGPYRLVRHPIYLAVVLLLFGTAHMTGDRLLFASLCTLYIIVAMPFEEAGLEAQFGARYVEYRRVVRWRLIPYII